MGDPGDRINVVSYREAQLQTNQVSAAVRKICSTLLQENGMYSPLSVHNKTKTERAPSQGQHAPPQQAKSTQVPAEEALSKQRQQQFIQLS